MRPRTKNFVWKCNERLQRHLWLANYNKRVIPRSSTCPSGACLCRLWLGDLLTLTSSTNWTNFASSCLRLLIFFVGWSIVSISSVRTASTNFSDGLRLLAETHGAVDSMDFEVCADKSICFRTEDASRSARIDVGVVFVPNHKQQQNEIYLQLPIPFSSDPVSI